MCSFVSSGPRPMGAVGYVSGHLTLSAEEFELHYAPRIREAVASGDLIVVGDARGADSMAQQLVKDLGGRAVIFHMFAKPRHNAGFACIGGFTTDDRRDCVMTMISDYDIAWVRPGREGSGTARNLERRGWKDRRWRLAEPSEPPVQRRG